MLLELIVLRQVLIQNHVLPCAAVQRVVALVLARLAVIVRTLYELGGSRVNARSLLVRWPLRGAHFDLIKPIGSVTHLA